MQHARSLQMVLAFAVLALAIVSYGDGQAPAWNWLVLIGVALAAVVVVDAWADRARLWQEPLTVRLAADVAAGLLLPALVALALGIALLTQAEVWLDVAIVLIVALAVVALI